MFGRLLVAAMFVVFGACGCSAQGDTGSADSGTRQPGSTAPTAPTAPSPTSPSLAVSGSVPSGTRPPVITSGPASGAAVALTFDADLTPGMQQKLREGRIDSYANMVVVDILQATDAPATIFFTGLWMEQYPEQTARIVADPRFELATHSQTHRAFRSDCYGLPTVAPAEMAAEVREPIEILARFTDRGSRYFRFPGLCHDEAALAAIAALGVTVVDGDASGDAGGTSASAIVDQTLRDIHPGSIVVMHLNGGDTAGFTDEALQPIIDGIRARGLRPVTLSQLLAGG